MTWTQEIDLRDRGVQIPTRDQWVDIPGSPFQVMTRGRDDIGIIHIRFKPELAHHWSEFRAMMESGEQ